MSTKYLDENGLLYFWGKIKSYVASHCGVTDVKYDTSTKKIQQQKNGGAYEDVVSVATIKSDLALTKSDVGLGNVDNTSDANKPISTATQTALDAKAPLASPALTGNPTAPTQSTSDDSTKLATTEFVHDVIDGLSTGVTGVKGDAESTYRTGQVNLTPANLGIVDFTGAASSAAGAHGLVPAPASGEQKNLLFGNGSWKQIAFGWNYDNDYVVHLIRKDSANTHTVLDSMTLQLANSGGTSHHGLMSSTDKAKLDTLSDGGCWYGTSSTAGNTAAKEITCSGFSLKTGAIIAVLFSENNTAATPTLNVNSTGAKSIHVGNATPNGNTNVLKWSDNTLVFFMYDGTQYKYLSSVADAAVSQPRGANTWYGSCHTSSATGAKRADIDNFVLTKGAVVILQMDTPNTTTTTLSLNVSSTGAKTIYAYGAATSTNNKFLWGAGAVLAFVYDGTYWRVLHEDFTYGNGLACGYINGLLHIALDLQSTTKLTNAATAATEVANRVYPVALDSNGDLAVNVPWTDTTTFAASAITSGTFDIARIPITGSVADGNTGLVTGDAVYDAIQGAISGITGISFNSSYTSVSDLPATGTAGVIYLIPNSGSNPNSYDEYVWVGSSYEKLGTTDVDLTGYLNTTNHIAITNAEIDTICV